MIEAVTDSGPAIEGSARRKSYGDFEALRGIDISVRRGEVFGLLGPNGAGKTTTVEILEGYRARSGGEEVLLRTDEPTRVLAELTAAAVARGEELEGLSVRRPSLEEVYLALTAEEEAEVAE